jgi:hypothetical protein
MDLFPLPIFPEGSLRESVVTTVWVGVFVISFFNLRFGWTYSGLVVPGYLVPLILTQPLSGTITIAEGMLAYGLVCLISEYLSRFRWWCGFFGRDRFFALLLAAVLVRVTVDGWCLPWLASLLQHQWNLTFDYKGSFHSFGLIIVALIANQFWKTGFWRGLTPFFVTLGITFFLVRYVLMTVTNFNVGHLSYMYSNAAASLLASPKSYIILIVTGFVASRMNLRYGWEYNGILIPALLALQWYEPLKIVSSLAEASVVFIVSDLLLGTALFRGMTMEGARKLLLFFNVAYLYRYCLGFILPLISPGIIVNDYYGFAYLLSSLIALKMHSKHIVLRLTRATLQTSFFAAVAANLLGLWLASMLGSIAFGNRPASTTMAQIERSAESVEAFAMKEKLRLFRKHSAESVTMPSPGELNQFREAMELIQKHAETGARKPLDLARIHLKDLHYALELLEPGRLCLREKEPGRGWGFYVLDLKKTGGLLVEVPAPLDEWAALEAGVQLYSRLNASTLAVAGGGRFVNKDGSSDVLVNANTPFEVFHHVFSRRNVLQVRGYTEEALRHLPGTATESALFVKAELPRSLSLNALKGQIREFRVFWKPASLPNAQQRRTKSGFAELWLPRTTRIQLKSELAQSLIGTREPAVDKQSLMPEWLLQQKHAIAKGGSNRYLPPAPEEMLFLDEEILTPLLEAAQTGYSTGGLTPLGRQMVQAINGSALLLGYEVCFHRDVSLNRDFLVLTESNGSSPKRYWGTFVIRLGEARSYAIQVPRPLYDLNTLDFGVQMFEQLQAESLLLAGSHNEANQDQAADVLNFRNTANLFSLVNQVAMREAHDEPKMMIQIRGYAPRPGWFHPPEILVAFQDGIRHASLITPLGKGLAERLAADGMRLQFVDGSPLSAGYEISCVPQAHYVNQSRNKEFAIVWLSPVLRESFRPQDDEFPLRVQLEALRIPLASDDLRIRLQNQPEVKAKTRLPPGLKSLLERYVATMDIVCLQRALKEWPQFEFSALLNRSSQQILLLIAERGENLPVVLNLRPRSTRASIETADPAERVDRFLAGRGQWLEWPL